MQGHVALRPHDWVQDPRGFRMILRPKNLLVERAQLLDILLLHLGQDHIGFRFRDDRDLEFPHTIPQLEVGFLSRQLVLCVSHPVVVVEVETSRCPAAHIS